MDRRAAKDAEIDIVRLEIEDLSRIVKDLTQRVKQGKASKEPLGKAVSALESKSSKLKILTQESKVLGDWIHGTIDYVPESKQNKFLVPILVSVLLLVIMR